MDDDAIVLDTLDHGESDLIVTFFTLAGGRLSAIAKGAKKSKKRFVNKLELFTFLHISYEQKITHSLGFLREAELHTSFPNIRQHPEFYTASTIVRELLLYAVRDGEQEQDLFRLSLWALHNFDKKKTSQSTLALFLIKFLSEIGYRPNLESCGSCETSFTSKNDYSFDPHTGGLKCSLCQKNSRSGIAVSNGTIKILQAAQNISLDRLHRVKISGKSLDESLKLLHNFTCQILQRDIISWKSLRKFQGPPATRKPPIA